MSVDEVGRFQQCPAEPLGFVAGERVFAAVATRAGQHAKANMGAVVLVVLHHVQLGLVLRGDPLVAVVPDVRVLQRPRDGRLPPRVVVAVRSSV
ncbi:MAG: hypothetical protein GEV00_17605 [Actinophytocola sp.]|nr:hypothetical protein [Actinophytocola sp.]